MKMSYFHGSLVPHTPEHSTTDQIKCISSQQQPARLVSYLAEAYAVCTGAIRRDMIHYRFERRRYCTTFNAFMLASLGMLTADHVLVLHAESHYIKCTKHNVLI
jgi:hypothetical protein